MEFATEMIVKSLDGDLVAREVGIPYRPRTGESKLSPFRDAWRHIEYMLIFSPALLFLLPGFLLSLFGFAVQLLLLSGPRAFIFRTWDVHTNLGGLVAALFGLTLVSLGMISAGYAWSIGMRFRHSATARFVAQHGQAIVRYLGLTMSAVGAAWWAVIGSGWIASGFGSLAAIPELSLASTLLAGGLGLVGTAFILHLIGLNR
jgi:hypothetical protein